MNSKELLKVEISVKIQKELQEEVVKIILKKVEETSNKYVN